MSPRVIAPVAVGIIVALLLFVGVIAGCSSSPPAADYTDENNNNGPDGNKANVARNSRAADRDTDATIRNAGDSFD